MVAASRSVARDAWIVLATTTRGMPWSPRGSLRARGRRRPRTSLVDRQDLAEADLHHETAIRSEDVAGLRAAVRARRGSHRSPPKSATRRLVLADFGRQRRPVAFGDVRRIGDDHDRAAAARRRDTSRERTACVRHAQTRRRSRGPRQVRPRDIGRVDVRVGIFERQRDGDAAAARADIGDAASRLRREDRRAPLRRCSSVSGTRNQHRRRDQKLAAPEFLSRRGCRRRARACSVAR